MAYSVVFVTSTHIGACNWETVFLQGLHTERVYCKVDKTDTLEISPWTVFRYKVNFERCNITCW